MYKHILIPVAHAHEGEYAQALKTARTLLDADGRITVLSVLEEVPAYVEAHVPGGYMEDNIAESSVALKTEFGTEGVETAVMTGHAANTIIDWAKGHDVDCIVVSSHRPGLSDYFIGSTAARVVRHAQCAVHVLR